MDLASIRLEYEKKANKNEKTEEARVIALGAFDEMSEVALEPGTFPSETEALEAIQRWADKRYTKDDPISKKSVEKMKVDGGDGSDESSGKMRDAKREEWQEMIGKALGTDLFNCEMTDDMYYKGCRVDDVTLMSMYAAIRDECIDRKVFWSTQVCDMQIGEYRKNHTRNRIKDLLNGLPAWDGIDRLSELARKISCTEDTEKVRRTLEIFLSGVFHKVFDNNHNYVLILIGPQRCGKSRLAAWLCPDKAFFVEGNIRPDSKDERIARARVLLREIPEVQNTLTEKMSNSVKSFLSEETIYERKSFGRIEIQKPTICSYIGTANDEGGIFYDQTGNRRYITLHVQDIEWDGDGSYTKMDKKQLWSQIREMYRQGKHIMSKDELKAKAEDLMQDTITDPVAEILAENMVESAGAFTSNGEIYDMLKLKGVKVDMSVSKKVVSFFRSKGCALKVKKLAGKTLKGYENFILSDKL